MPIPIAFWLLAITAIQGQTEPATQPAPSMPSPDHSALLADVQDFTPNFDDRAFYAMVQSVAAQRQSAASQSAATQAICNAVPPFVPSHLLERPSEFRGAMGSLSGIVAAAQAYTLHSPAYGANWLVTQVELAVDGGSFVCTIILPHEADVPALGSRLSLCGEFLKVRQFQSRRGQTAYAPLIVAHQWRLQKAVSASQATGIGVADLGMREAGFMCMLIGGLAVAWLLLRRNARRRSHRPAPAGVIGKSAKPPDYTWVEQPGPTADLR